MPETAYGKKRIDPGLIYQTGLIREDIGEVIIHRGGNYGDGTAAFHRGPPPDVLSRADPCR